MFTNNGRCRYQSNPLAEVICQLRFPEILAISSIPPVDFQEAIRSEYPGFLRRQEFPAPRITGTGENVTVQKPLPVINYQFSSPDGAWRINLTGTFISLTCSRYTCWEEFAAKLDRPLAAFIRIYHPAYFERIGLRYMNFISRSALGLEGVPFSQLIQPCYLGPLMEEDVSESAAARCTVDAEIAIRGGCRAKLHAGPGLVKRGSKEDQEVKFIFDQDLYMPGQLPPNLVAGALHTLHAQADSIFRGAVTEKLHNAMEPEEI